MLAAPRTRQRATREDFDAIVVGSGVGGSVASALLAKGGRRVLVLEKNPVLGGVLASYRRDGFKIDIGSHLISRGERGPLGQVLRGLGLTQPRFLKHRIPLRSRGMFEATAPEHRRELPQVGLKAAHDLGLSAKQTATMARMLFQIFTLTEWELRKWDRRTLDAFILQHSDNPRAYFLFSFMASIFFVLPPWQVSAGEAIRSLRHVLWDYSLSYVEGGMDSLAFALLSLVEPAGGEVVTGHKVVSVRRTQHGLRVATADGAEYRAPVVCCNMAAKDAVALVDGDMPPDYAHRVAHVVPSGNAHQVKLALRKKLVDEGCIIAGVSLNGLTLSDLSVPLMHESVGAIEVGRVSDPLAIYAPVPTNYDPSLAPDGAQLIVASIYGPVCDEPEDSPEKWRQRSLAALAKIIPGLEENLLFADFRPIRSIGAWMGKSSSAAICNGQLPGQVGRDRLPVKTPVPGLYLCGDGAGGRGIGTELAAESALEAVACIQKEARS